MNKERDKLINAYIGLATDQIQKGGSIRLLTPVLETYLDSLKTQGGGATYDSAVNKLTAQYNKTVKGLPKDLTRKLAPGEKHTIVKSKRKGFEGTLQPDLFSGPDTDVNRSLNELVARSGVKMTAKELFKKDPELLKNIILNDDLFDSGVSQVAMTHDARYGLLSGSDPEGIRDADNRMLNKLEDVRASEGLFNYIPSWSGIRIKKMMEDVGLFKKGSFGGDEPSITGDDRPMWEYIESEMRKAGYGRRMRPLRNK